MLGSFIATGLAPALWLLLALSLRQRGGGNSVARAAGCFLRLAGADPVACRPVGRCPAAVLLLWRFARQHPAVSRWAGGALLLGIALGLMVLFTGFGPMAAQVLSHAKAPIIHV